MILILIIAIINWNIVIIDTPGNSIGNNNNNDNNI